MLAWTIESIPSTDWLYHRVHKTLYEKFPGPSIFRPKNGALSTDWSRYSTPEEARARARHPAENTIVHFKVEHVEGQCLGVKHSPVSPSERFPQGNRSHADVTYDIGDATADLAARVKIHRAWDAGGRLCAPIAW